MIPASAGDAQPADWRRLFREGLMTPAQLLERLGLPELADHVPADAAGFPVRAPAPYLARIRKGDPHDPLLRQVLPLDDELQPMPGFAIDAVGDLDSRKSRGVLHKYRGRALLVATGSCAVHCRYCFRRHFPYGDEVAAANQWTDAVDYLRADASIEEVLLSGGDPWSLATPKLAELTRQLAALPHLRRLRIHTRLPVVIPQRVDAELLDWLAALPWPVAIVLHINHAQEVDDEVTAACTRLRRSGAHLLNQAVLLRGINDSVDALAALSRRLFDAGVLPYYLHQLDRVQGSAHFEVSDTAAQDLHVMLRAELPGYLVPKLVREVSGEPFKTPM